MNDLMRLFASQLPILGAQGQAALAKAQVLVVGAGRLGTATLNNLAAAGIGSITIVDPQTVERENRGALLHTGEQNIGQAKALVLSRAFPDRPWLRITPVCAPVEARTVDQYIDRADLVILAPNNVAARRCGAQKALGKPTIAAGVADGREALSASVSFRLPGTWHACAACYLPGQTARVCDEGLLWSVIALAAAHAAHIAVQHLTQLQNTVFETLNAWWIDATTHTTQGLAIQRRHDCDICGEPPRVASDSALPRPQRDSTMRHDHEHCMASAGA